MDIVIGCLIGSFAGALLSGAGFYMVIGRVVLERADKFVIGSHVDALAKVVEMQGKLAGDLSEVWVGVIADIDRRLELAQEPRAVTIGQGTGVEEQVLDVPKEQAGAEGTESEGMDAQPVSTRRRFFKDR